MKQFEATFLVLVLDVEGEGEEGAGEGVHGQQQLHHQRAVLREPSVPRPHVNGRQAVGVTEVKETALAQHTEYHGSSYHVFITRYKIVD